MLTEDVQARLVLPDRARRRLRRLRHAHDGRAQGRQVRHQRLEVLHHQRRLRRLVHGLRQDRQGGRAPRHLLLPGPPRRRPSSVDKKEDKMGQRASNTATITFNETEIPAGNLIGEENKGFKLAMMTLDRTRPGVAAMAIGIARAAFEFATQLLEGARPVRRADRDAPGDPVHDRRHGDEGAPLAPRDLELGRPARPGPAQHGRVLARQALRGRHRDGGRASTRCRSTAATASSRTTRSRS